MFDLGSNRKGCGGDANADGVDADADLNALKGSSQLLNANCGSMNCGNDNSVDDPNFR